MSKFARMFEVTGLLSMCIYLFNINLTSLIITVVLFGISFTLEIINFIKEETNE